jgi:predicted nucleic acid-binding protein
MTGRVFVDTNVLVYAHDIDAGDKHKVAAERIVELWESRSGLISVQVLQEFYVTVTRKIPAPIPRAVARSILANYSVWHLETAGPETVLAASEIEERYQLSFGDALIVAAAAQGGADVLLTEDLASGQTIEGVRILNPFETPADTAAGAAASPPAAIPSPDT